MYHLNSQLWINMKNTKIFRLSLLLSLCIATFCINSCQKDLQDLPDELKLHILAQNLKTTILNNDIFNPFKDIKIYLNLIFKINRTFRTLIPDLISKSKKIAIEHFTQDIDIKDEDDLKNQLLDILSFDLSKDKEELKDQELKAAKLIILALKLNLKINNEHIIFYLIRKNKDNYNLINLLKVILIYSTNIETINNKGQHPLIMAVHKGQKETIELLLNYGVDINLQDKQGNNSLIILLKNVFLDKNLVKEIAEIFIKNGINVNLKNNLGENALTIACKRGLLEIVKLLINNNADMYSLDPWGTSPLGSAIKHNRIDVAKFLIAHNKKSLKDSDYLHIAVENDRKDMVELLLDSTDININSHYNNRSALITACQNDFYNLAQFLCEKGANVNDRIYGFGFDTLLMIVVNAGNYRMVKLLIDFHVSINDQNLHGDTALIEATRIGNYNIIKLLLDSGANTRIKNNEKLTAELIAREYSDDNHKKIAQLLKDNASWICLLS